MRTKNEHLAERIMDMEGLLSFWDFQKRNMDGYTAIGPYPYRLEEARGSVAYSGDGVFGERSVQLIDGRYLSCPRSACPALDIHGPEAEVSVVAWVKREIRQSQGCEAVAGMWLETEKKRQYCLFLNLEIWDSAEQVCGHVSSVGGPTPGYKWSMTSSIGQTPVSKGVWHTVAFTYDGKHAKSYLDGRLDVREHFNPFAYSEGVFDAGKDGADFTVGAVHRSGEMGNFYNGLLGGLAVFNRALTEEEMLHLKL